MSAQQGWNLSISARSPQDLLGQMSRLYIVSRAIHAIAELGIADRIGETPVPASDVARDAGVSAAYLTRCLRYLAAYGVFEESSPGRFRATALSVLMRDDHPGSMRPVLRMVSDEWWNAAGRLGEVLRSETSGIELATGRNFFELLGEKPELQTRFDEGISSISGMDDQRLAAAYDFSGTGLVVDLAGGNGNFLREVLRRNPGRTGILFEQPQVIAETTLLEEEVRAGRARLVAGNLFEVLPAPADLYVIKGTLHNFGDQRALAILRKCAQAMQASRGPRGNARLLIIEQIIPPGNAPHLNKTLDMVMMFLLGGRQRTLDEWAALLASAGLTPPKVIPTETNYSLLEVNC